MSRLKGGSPEIEEPPIRISPADGCSNPAIMRRVVVFPDPEAPSSVRNSPAAISNERSSTATNSPKRLVRRSSSRIGVRSFPGFDLVPDFLVLLAPGAPLPEVDLASVVADIALTGGLVGRHILLGCRVGDDVGGDVIQQLLGKRLSGVLQPGVPGIQVLGTLGQYPVIGPGGGPFFGDRLPGWELGL